jgi:hypothetical protein
MYKVFSFMGKGDGMIEFALGLLGGFILAAVLIWFALGE